MDFVYFTKLFNIVTGFCFTFFRAFHTGKPALLFCKFFMAFTIIFMVGACIAITVNIQTVRGIIKTDSVIRYWNRRNISCKFKKHRYIIFAIAFLRYSCRLNNPVSIRPAVNYSFNLTDFRQLYSITNNSNSAFLIIGGIGFSAVFGRLEFRKSILPFAGFVETASESALQI